jgi:glutathione peroxidase-family protein
MTSIYDFKAIRNNGSELDFADYKGKVVGRFEPTTEPAQLGQPIEEQLK